MAISASLVKELRERTGLGMMECKKALKETDGNVDLAIENLRKLSGLKAAKKAGRTAADGVVAVQIAADGSYGSVIELNSETDFVARDEGFLAFADKVLGAAFDSKAADAAAVMAGELEAEREALVQKIGENIGLRRVATLSADAGVVGAYKHSNNRIAVLVELKGGDVELAKDIAMHIAAVNPAVVSPDQMPEELVNQEKDIIASQPDMEGKPAAIVEKMVQGRIAKFLKEGSLIEQPFVKNPELTVGALAKQAGAEVVSFIRFEVGEGIEVEEADFAAEVAAQVAAAQS